MANPRADRGRQVIEPRGGRWMQVTIEVAMVNVEVSVIRMELSECESLESVEVMRRQENTHAQYPLTSEAAADFSARS